MTWRVQLDGLLDVGRETLQDRVENTAGFAGGDHVREEVVEDLGMLAHRVGEARAGLDVLADLHERALEGLVFLLAAEDLEALHERQTGVDHDRELPGEDRDELRRNLPPNFGTAISFPFSLTAVTIDLLPPQNGA